MKRKRKSPLPKTQMRKIDDEQIQMSGSSIIDLPTTIVVEIVMKLPVKSIIACKSVCKTWRSLISDPHFAELHFAQAKTCTLVRDLNDARIARILYLLGPEDFCRPDSGYCRCRPHKRCKHGRFNTKVNAKLKIPLDNVQVMLDKVGNRYDSRAVFFVYLTGNCRHLVELMSCYDHMYDDLSSCNGLLCLSRKKESDTRIVVCNPVTGEFIYLPEKCSDRSNNETLSRSIAFGSSSKHNQFKVVRIARVQLEGDVRVNIAEILTIGTDSWRRLDFSAVNLGNLLSCAYLDGALHWLFSESFEEYRMASLDLDEERLQVHSIPPGFPRCDIRALGGHIYLSTEFAYTHVDIWVMGDNGVSKSWTKLFSVDVSELHEPGERHRYKLMCCLNNEAVVLLGGPWREFMYYDETEGLRFKLLKFQGFVSDFEATSHTPSLISLKDILKVDDIEVLSVNTGCGRLKLSEETFPLLLREARN